jgi:hypothetical protein
VLLSETGTVGSDEVVVDVIRYRKELGTGDIYDLLADQKMNGKGIILDGILCRDRS